MYKLLAREEETDFHIAYGDTTCHDCGGCDLSTIEMKVMVQESDFEVDRRSGLVGQSTVACGTFA